MKNIKESNRLILEFMNIKPRMDQPDVYSWNDGVFFMVREDNPEKVMDAIVRYAKYHSDWNWLMNVLKEMDNLEFELPEDSNLVGDITHGLLSLDIEMTYEAVVEFIRWYNKNK